MIRFLHTADWQLGMTRRFLSPEAQARFTQARIDSIATMGALAVREGCAFVVVCGDVFEHNFVNRQVVVRALEAMGGAGVPFYLLPGNHDPLDAGSVYRSTTFCQHRPANVVVLEGPGVHEILPGVELVAAPWSSKRPLSDLVTDAVVGAGGPPPAGDVRIAVGHGAIDSVAPDIDNPAIIRQADLDRLIEAGAVHFVALGDRHSTTAAGATGRVWYSGAPEPTDFDEVDPGNALVVEVDAASCRVTSHAVGTWRFAREKFHLDGIEDVDTVARWFAALPAKDRTIVRLSLIGTLPLRAHAALTDLLAFNTELFAAIEQSERHSDLAVVPDDADFSDLELTGFAAEAVEDLRSQLTAPGAEAQVAADALALLFRLTGGAG